MICRTCTIDKADTEFYANGRGGLRFQCKVCTRERDRIWREENREDRLIKKAENNAQRASVPKDLPYPLSPEMRWAIIEFYGNQCCKCGSDDRLQIDHVIPLTWPGASHSLSNIQVLCTRDNIIKSNLSSADYRGGAVVTMEFINKHMEESAR